MHSYDRKLNGEKDQKNLVLNHISAAPNARIKELVNKKQKESNLIISYLNLTTCIYYSKFEIIILAGLEHFLNFFVIECSVTPHRFDIYIGVFWAAGRVSTKDPRWRDSFLRGAVVDCCGSCCC